MDKMYKLVSMENGRTFSLFFETRRDAKHVLFLLRKRNADEGFRIKTDWGVHNKLYTWTGK